MRAGAQVVPRLWRAARRPSFHKASALEAAAIAAFRFTSWCRDNERAFAAQSALPRRCRRRWARIRRRAMGARPRLPAAPDEPRAVLLAISRRK